MPTPRRHSGQQRVEAQVDDRLIPDIVVLAPTRWKLRRAVKTVNGHLGVLDLDRHPAKTFIGRIEKGFDFLGYHFSRAGLTVASATVERFVERATRLYEQERVESRETPLLGQYVRRWLGWARGGLGDKRKPRTEAKISGEDPKFEIAVWRYAKKKELVAISFKNSRSG